MGSGNFEGEGHVPTSQSCAVSCAQTAEPIEMLFGLWTRVGKKNHVSDDVVLDTHKGRDNFEGYLPPLKSIVKHRILGVG